MASECDTLVVEFIPCKRPRYHGWAQQTSKRAVPSANLSFNSGVASIDISAAEDCVIASPVAVSLSTTVDVDAQSNDAPPPPPPPPPTRSTSTTANAEPDSTPFKFSFTVPWKDLWDAQQALPDTPNSFWTHSMYKGPGGKNVKIEYCQTKAESEAVAKTLLKEKVLGFDMEWCPRAKKGIKGNISLIQVACEDRIALFHIALYEGSTVEDLLAPSLKEIIESLAITKTGVAILNADGQRLKRFMGLKVKGFFELSHLFRLVKYSEKTPGKANKTLVALATQVEEQLGLPLSKGPVRCSDWTQPLTQEQITYGASDAYAGFMLFHVMNNARMALRPTPPLPAFAELFRPIRLAEPVKNDNPEEATTSESGVAPATALAEPREQTAASIKYPKLPSSASNEKVSTLSRPTFRPPPALSLTLAPLEKRVYSALSALSKRVATLSQLPMHLICSDDTLAELSRKRPATDEVLQACRGGLAFSTLLAQHNLDLFAFIKKYTPEMHVAGGRRSANGATVLLCPLQATAGCVRQTRRLGKKLRVERQCSQAS